MAQFECDKCGCGVNENAPHIYPDGTFCKRCWKKLSDAEKRKILSHPFLGLSKNAIDEMIAQKIHPNFEIH